jgi:4'-phosphopantetheinyl transferase
MNTLCWQPHPGQASPLADDLHLWKLDTRLCLSHINAFSAALSPDETARAKRFKFPRDRDRFIFAHGFKRQVLAKYAGAPPDALCFVENQYGKPALADSLIRFNFSHSGDLVLLGVMNQVDVGVDVERTNKAVDYLQLAERFFHPNEAKKINHCNGDARRQAFYKTWTSKEAYIKAVGKGLSLPLDSFEVEALPDQPAAILDSHDTKNRRSIHALNIGKDYAAAVVMDKAASVILMFNECNHLNIRC